MLAGQIRIPIAHALRIGNHILRHLLSFQSRNLGIYIFALNPREDCTLCSQTEHILPFMRRSLGAVMRALQAGDEIAIVEYPVWVDGFFDRAALDRLDTGGLAGEGYSLVISIFM